MIELVVVAGVWLALRFPDFFPTLPYLLFIVASRSIARKEENAEN